MSSAGACRSATPARAIAARADRGRSGDPLLPLHHRRRARVAGRSQHRRHRRRRDAVSAIVAGAALHQLRLKPALRLLLSSPVAVSLTAPVTLTGPPNNRCSALSERRQPSSAVEPVAPIDSVVFSGRKVKRTAWFPSTAWPLDPCATIGAPSSSGCVHAKRVLQRQRHVAADRHRAAQRHAEAGLLIGIDAGLDRGLSQAISPGAVTLAQATPTVCSGVMPGSQCPGRISALGVPSR